MFVPPMSNIVLRFMKSKDRDINGKSYVSWWEENSIVQYDKVLAAMPYFKDTNLYDDFHIRKDMKIILDSGGFELLSKRSRGEKLDLEAKDVIEWQEKNGNIGIILDHPPVRIVGDAGHGTVVPLDNDSHMECAKETRSNLEIMNKYRTSSEKDFLMYNVMQGGDLERIDRWYKTCFENAEGMYQGVACAPKPPSMAFEVAKSLVYLYNKGHTKNIHTLGVAGKSTVPAIIYMYKYIENLTYDSATYAQGRINNTFADPYSMQLIQVSNRSPEKSISAMPCMCPVCESVKEEHLKNDKLLPQIMTAHNLQTYINYNKSLEKALSNKEIFFQMAETFCPDIRTIAEFIDFAVETKDVERAVQKFEHKGNYFLKGQMKQASVFDF